MYVPSQCMLIVLTQGLKEIAQMSIVAVPLHPTMEFMFGEKHPLYLSRCTIACASGSLTTKDMYEWCVAHDVKSIEYFQSASMTFCNMIMNCIRPILGEHMEEAGENFLEMSHALRLNLFLLRAFLQVAYSDNERILNNMLESSDCQHRHKRRKLNSETAEA